MKNYRKSISLLTLIAALLLQPTKSFAQATGETGMKWYPGHYIMNKLDDKQTNELLTKFSDITVFRGLQKEYFWSDLEPSKGVYDFSKIDQDLATVKKYGKKLSIIVVYKYKASPTQSSLPQYVLNFKPALVGKLSVPAYFVQGKPNDGIWNVGDHANFGHPQTLEAFTNILNALAKKYDNNPDIAFMQFSETSIGADVSQAIQDNFINGIIAMDQRASTAFTHTPLIQSINFPRNRLADLVGNVKNQKMGFGGPDTFWGSFNDPKNALAFNYNNTPYRGIYWYNIANYTNSDGSIRINTLPIAMQVHTGGFIYDTREHELAEIKHNLPLNDSVKKVYDFSYNKLRSNFIVWQVFGSGDANRKALEAGLRSGTMRTRTACPLVYDNTCVN